MACGRSLNDPERLDGADMELRCQISELTVHLQFNQKRYIAYIVCNIIQPYCNVIVYIGKEGERREHGEGVGEEKRA